MHILTLTTLFPNRLQPLLAVFVRTRMEAFTRKFGHDWTVVAPVPYFPRLPFRLNPRYDTLARVPALENDRGYPVYHPRYLVTPRYGMRWYGLWMYLGLRETARRIHREKPIDVIDAHYVFPDGEAAARLGRELNVPVIVSARGTDLNVFPGIAPVRARMRRALEACRTLICVSGDLKQKALEMGVSEAKIRVIGNGIDAGRFGRGDAALARERAGLPREGKIFLSVGNLIEGKGFHILIEALAGLGRPDVTLAIAGQGPMRAQLKAQAENLGVARQVILAGGVPNAELPTWYQAADVFALATAREGWPNVVSEAQACGLPVVATRISGIPEIVTGPSLGILPAERSVAAFRQAMAEALGKKWDRDRISATGRSRTWDRVADELAGIFDPAGL